mmetsp:Transcript_20665/g.60044  ORF Transcript_20665/g.60044 Transcript_20665/m.60044 type:complete len:256 (-) Transcript_20665:506-1273(-)
MARSGRYRHRRIVQPRLSARSLPQPIPRPSRGRFPPQYRRAVRDRSAGDERGRKIPLRRQDVSGGELESSDRHARRRGGGGDTVRRRSFVRRRSEVETHAGMEIVFHRARNRRGDESVSGEFTPAAQDHRFTKIEGRTQPVRRRGTTERRRPQLRRGTRGAAPNRRRRRRGQGRTHAIGRTIPRGVSSGMGTNVSCRISGFAIRIFRTELRVRVYVQGIQFGIRFRRITIVPYAGGVVASRFVVGRLSEFGIRIR